MASTIVKHHKRASEPFSLDKVKASVYAAFLSVHSQDGVARDTAESIANTIAQWLHNKPEVTSLDIRNRVTALITPIHPDAAYIYQHHKQII